jgi:hypothetical protein
MQEHPSSDVHEIRLRAGWECVADDDSTSRPTRLTLPAPMGSRPAGRLRLTRWFNRPPRVEVGPVVLRLSQSPGIRSIVFNGQPAGPIPPDRPDLEVEVGLLAARNELTIEAEPPADAAEWGRISLVFR